MFYFTLQNFFVYTFTWKHAIYPSQLRLFCILHMYDLQDVNKYLQIAWTLVHSFWLGIKSEIE